MLAFLQQLVEQSKHREWIAMLAESENFTAP
jgi:hypothetical protein